MIATPESTAPAAQPQARGACFHCGEPAKTGAFVSEGKEFCCKGCQTVYEVLAERNLCDYYSLNAAPGIRVADAPGEFDYLDEPDTLGRLLRYSDEQIARVVFDVPGIHCSSCIWLLENLPRLHPGVQNAEVNFGRKQVAITWRRQATRLGAIVASLHQIGYAPILTLDKADEAGRKHDPEFRRLVLRLGVAGFAFGNLMLLAFPEYLTDEAISTGLFRLFGYLSLALALPLYFYSGGIYLTSAIKGLRRRYFSIDLPLAIGMTVMLGRSAFEILSGTGMGYLDSLGGLIFFLLVGRLFQHKTYSYLSFERDYKAYFPLAIQRLEADGTPRTVAVSALKANDRIWVRNGEVVPADALLVSDAAHFDNAFLTGEAAPVRRCRGDVVYAGGRVLGEAAELVVQRTVSNSALAELWNHPAFRKPADGGYTVLINRISKYFTYGVLLVSALTAAYWLWADPAKAADATTAVLIIACPCALAFAAPFTFGHLVRFFGRNGLFLKNADVVEHLATVDTVVFDKTGTLTNPAAAPEVAWAHGSEPSALALSACVSLARQSAHPISTALAAAYAFVPTEPIAGVNEVSGMGLLGLLRNGKKVCIGKAAFCGVPEAHDNHTYVWVEGEGVFAFAVRPAYRPELHSLFANLEPDAYVVSGDNETEAPALKTWFPRAGRLFFRQSPEAKLRMVQRLQAQGRNVAMVGDGLNDAGALLQARVGVSICEHSAQFTPASDAILQGSQLGQLPLFLRLSRGSLRIIRVLFGISLAYNLTGTFFAVQGELEPVIAAILMPFSSVGIILMATAATIAMCRRAGLR